MDDQLFDQITDLLTTKFEVEPENLHTDAALDDLGLDSLAQVELGEVLAERFNVDIDEDEVVELATLSELIDMLAAKVAQKNAGV